MVNIKRHSSKSQGTLRPTPNYARPLSPNLQPRHQVIQKIIDRPTIGPTSLSTKVHKLPRKNEKKIMISKKKMLWEVRMPWAVDEAVSKWTQEICQRSCCWIVSLKCLQVQNKVNWKNTWNPFISALDPCKKLDQSACTHHDSTTHRLEVAVHTRSAYIVSQL